MPVGNRTWQSTARGLAIVARCSVAAVPLAFATCWSTPWGCLTELFASGGLPLFRIAGDPGERNH